MFTRILLGMALLTATAWGQQTPAQKTDEEPNYPRLIHAELPLYPPLALSAHISGTIEIQVAVANGGVVDARVKSVEIQITDPQNHAVYDDQAKSKVSQVLSNPSVANVRTWQFQSEGRANFIVRYVYQIVGEQTSLPENPRVELDLPVFVKITARPFKPTCSDCSSSTPSN